MWIAVTPADIPTEFILIGSRSGDHHAVTLSDFVVCDVATCMQDNLMACLLCGSVRKCNWVTAGRTSEVTRSKFAVGACCYGVETDRYSLSDTSVDWSIYFFS